jgi:hypothetical protein
VDTVPTPPRAVAFVSKQLWRVNQGLARVGIFWNIFSFLTFVGVWQESFEYWGISIGAVFLALGLGYFLTAWIVGLFNETKQFSRAEWEHQIAVQNPEYWELIRDASKCRVMLETICEGENVKH